MILSVFIFRRIVFDCNKQFGHRKENYILFHIINSMDVPTYLMMLLTALGLNVYGLIKYRKVKAPWKVLVYGNPVILIVLAINRVIEEYAPDTHLYNVSVAVTLTIGGIFFIALIVVAYITKKKQ